MRPFVLLSLFALLPAAPSRAAVYLVGGDAACTHISIQPAVDAAAANPGPDVIVVTRSAVYTSQSIVVNTNENLSIVGGQANCITIFGDYLYTDVDGTGGSNASVFRIRGGPDAEITLSHLRIRGGDPSPLDGLGGGIRYDGSGLLVLRDLAVINNTAFKGGGIYVDGDVDSAELYLGANVTISGNTATGDGGGVFVNGMRMHMREPNSIIAFNEALGTGTSTGYGGGLAVRSTHDRDADAFVSSPGVGSLGAIYGNQAVRGGGVAVSAGSDSGEYDNAMLHLSSVDAGQPGAIRGNFASSVGGGIYLWPNQNASTDSFADAKLLRAEITGNAAPEGAAIYADNSSVTLNGPIGGIVHVNMSEMPGSLPCPANAPCGLIADNIAEDANGTDTDGAVILLDGGSEFRARRGLVIRGNRAGRLLDAKDADEFFEARFELQDALVHRNIVRQELFRGNGNAQLMLADTTVADNTIAAPHIISASRGNVLLRRSIIWQPGSVTLTSGSGAPVVADVVASEAASIGGGPAAIVAMPRFVDPARADYALRAASPAIDFAPPVTGDDRDAYGAPRDQRIDIVPRAPGRVRDVGAIERQRALPLVLNGEFGGDTHLWFLPSGHAGNFQVNDAPGSTAPGSAQVAAPGTADRLLGYAQCIEIPGPGIYALNGSARSEGDPALANDTALIWELRDDGGDGCLDGAITANGVHYLSSRGTTDQWARPAQPALITIPAAAWNFRTSVTVILAVYPNASNSGFNGLFDRITLEPAGPVAPPADLLFSNGFEE